MQITITGRHMEMTDALKEHVENKLTKVRSHFDRAIDANVVLSVEKHRHIAEITIHANGVSLHGKFSSPDMYASVDSVVEKLEKQARKVKKQRIGRSHARRSREQLEYEESGASTAASGDMEDEDSRPRRVVVREELTMKPMSVEEATMQLELAGEPFLVFSNADTQQVNVIYARDDGTYGLIEPQF